MSQSGSTREGLYRIKVSWNRIKEELDQGRPKKQIYEELKNDDLYNYSYQSFLKTLKSELKKSEQQNPVQNPAGNISELTSKKKGDGIFVKPDPEEEKAKASKMKSKYLN